MKRNVTRRGFLRVAGMGVAAGALAACAAPAAAPKATEAPKAEAPKEAPAAQSSGELTGSLVFWGHQDHPIYVAGQAFIKKNPGVKFEAVVKDDWVAAAEAAIAAGSGLPDLTWLEASQIQLYARRGQMLDVTDVVKKHETELAPAKLAEASYQGKYWGMPGDITPNNYWWRPDLLEKAGIKEISPDIKYEDFLQMAKQVKDKTGASLYVQDATLTGQTNLMYWVPLYSLGGNISDATGEKIVMDDEIGIQAVTLAKQAWDLGAGLDAVWLSAPYYGALKDGKLAGTYSPPWMRGFYESQLATPEEGLGKWRDMLLPAYPGGKARGNVWGGATLNSWAGNPQADVVKAFMEFTFCTMEGAQVTGDWGIIPPFIPWLKSDFKSAKQKLFESGWDWTGEIVKSMEQMRTDFYRLPAYGIADGSIAKFLLPIFKGEKPIADGVKEWAAYVNSENKKQMEAIK